MPMEGAEQQGNDLRSQWADNDHPDKKEQVGLKRDLLAVKHTNLHIPGLIALLNPHQRESGRIEAD